MITASDQHLLAPDPVAEVPEHQPSEGRARNPTAKVAERRELGRPGHSGR